jgi:hypothetical protein
MKQPERLIHTGSPRARALLASLDEDVPPDLAGGQAQTLRALGVTAGASAAAPDRTRIASHRAMPLVSVAALGLVSLIVFAVSNDRGAASTSNAAPLAVEADRAITSSPTVTPAIGSSAEAAVAAPGVDVHALASAPQGGRVDAKAVRPNMGSVRRDLGRPAPPAATVNPPANPAREITDEIQLLERAQAAAARGRGEEALSLVALHRRDFPQGRFSVEMSVVEIEALAGSGLVEQAVARGERFLESHPGSPYARRVEAVVRLRGQKEQSR